MVADLTGLLAPGAALALAVRLRHDRSRAWLAFGGATALFAAGVIFVSGLDTVDGGSGSLALGLVRMAAGTLLALGGNLSVCRSVDAAGGPPPTTARSYALGALLVLAIEGACQAAYAGLLSVAAGATADQVQTATTVAYALVTFFGMVAIGWVGLGGSALAHRRLGAG